MIVVAFFIAAAAPILNEQQIKCMRHIVTSEQACAWQEFRRDDAKLGSVWKMALAAADKIDRRNLDPHMVGAGPSGIPKETARATLLASQRAFLIYREETCNFIRHINSPGSKAPADQAHCLAKITKDRTLQLHDFHILESS